jgi:hypothetical protein
MSDEGNYKVKLRYYDSTESVVADRWKTDDAEYEMDASDLDMSISVGDKVVAWWNSQRGSFIPCGGGGGGSPLKFAQLLSTMNAGGTAHAQPLKYDEATDTLIVDESASPILLYDFTMVSGGFDTGTQVRYDVDEGGRNAVTFPPCLVMME